MSIRYSPLTIETLPAVGKLLIPFWERSWNPDLRDRILHWRFIERSGGEAILAMDGDRCVAMVDSWIRPCILEGETTSLREMADWYSLPDIRGVGLQPMWMMMRKPQPIVGVGGTDDTQSLLPRLKWKAMSQEVAYFRLQLTSKALFDRLGQKLSTADSSRWLGFAKRPSISIGRVRRSAPPAGDEDVQRLENPDLIASVRPASADYSLARLVNSEELEWLHTAPPEMGEFRSLLFSIGGRPVGFSISRLFSHRRMLEGRILHIQASEASAQMYAWIVGETASDLAGSGADLIRCRTTCPDFQDGLRTSGFVQYSSMYPRWWSREFEMPRGKILLSWLRGDDGLIPYP